MLKDALRQRSDQDQHAKDALKRQLANLDKQQDALIERMVESTNPKTITAFEDKITKLEDEKLLIEDKLT